MFKDKVVVITGAGSGLGRELAKAFCREGATVVGLGRSADSLAKTKAAMDNGLFHSYSVDITQDEELNDAVAKIISDHGRIDVLFNNAAVYPKINFLDESASQFASALASNLNSVAFCCKAILPHMLKQNFGRIYNVGSWADIAPIVNSAVYSCTKGGLHALTKAMAKDIAQQDKNVEVHEWIPGHMNTQMSEYTGMDPRVPAAWAVAMVSRTNTSKNHIFDGDSIWLPPRSLKQKLKAKLLFWK
ncbi:MAG: NAD(P)-dependent dehydrogenase (short-subunit alcohol dehydrogenase family) [Lentisphaeria bacterium]|jgi:NAD(P)-dependent dehydrogenase (short-subunit alcohol dehydrogenase family)